MTSALAYVNGRFCPIEQATVSVEDRGFQFGDSVYEVIVSYGGRPFLLREHLDRLEHSVQVIGLPFDFDHTPLEPIIREGLRRCGLADALVYIQISRGAAPRAHIPPAHTQPTLVMTFRATDPLPPHKREAGLRVMTTPEIRWAKCFIKAVTLLPNVLAKMEARRRGLDDAIFVDGEEVREATAANVFAVHDGRLHIPPRDEHVLHGITQQFIMQCAGSIGVPLEEQALSVSLLKRADEVFLSSSTLEVAGVVEVDGTRIGTGQVGPITRRLYEEFYAQVRGLKAAGSAVACA